MENTQSIQGAGKSAIEAATRQYNLVFAGYMFLVVLVAFFTYLLWNSGNKVQDVVRTEASARIEEAKTLGSQANERSKKLEQENLVLRTDLNAESGKVAGLQKVAADAKAAQQRVEIDLTNAQTKLEAERLTRLQFQRSVWQRMIPQITDGTKSNFDVLKPFKGIRVLFEHSPEREPGAFAGGLAAIAGNAGWNMLGEWWTKEAAKGAIADGVTVEAYVGPNGETDSSSDAADAFAGFLKTNGIDEVRRLPAKRGDLPPNTVRVRVGQIPDPLKRIPK